MFSIYKGDMHKLWGGLNTRLAFKYLVCTVCVCGMAMLTTPVMWLSLVPIYALLYLRRKEVFMVLKGTITSRLGSATYATFEGMYKEVVIGRNNKGEVGDKLYLVMGEGTMCVLLGESRRLEAYLKEKCVLLETGGAESVKEKIVHLY